MKTFKKAFCAVIASLLLSTAAYAAEKLQQPKVEYSADTYFETEQTSFKGRTYHAFNGKDRQEMNAEGSSQITIVRLDKQIAWMLMPESKMYMETNLKAGEKDSRDITDCTIDQKISGTESVNGITATRSKISMSCPEGIQYTGDMWVTKDGIMVKMDATGKTKGSKTVRFKSELKNLKIGKQNPDLFEIPAGYAKMSMGDMMKGSVSPDTKKQSTGKVTKPQTDGDYTSPQRTGRDYTSQSRKGRDYTAQRRENPSDNVDNAVRKVRGLFGF